MSEFKGTKGPWFKEVGTRGIGPRSTENDQSFGMVLPVAWVEFETEDAIQQANANIIAAAPELLKALEFVLPWIPEADGEAIHLAESAIAKAIGK